MTIFERWFMARAAGNGGSTFAPGGETGGVFLPSSHQFDQTADVQNRTGRPADGRTLFGLQRDFEQLIRLQRRQALDRHITRLSRSDQAQRNRCLPGIGLGP